MKELEAEKDLDKETVSYSTLTQSLVAQGKLSDAEQASAHADALLANGQNRGVRLFVAVTDAKLLAASGKLSEARRKIVPIVNSAKKYGFREYDLQARFALAEIEMQLHHTAIGRSLLDSVELDAQKRGFGLIAGKAIATRNQQGRISLQQ